MNSTAEDFTLPASFSGDSAKIDWMGLWYVVARERGVNDIASFGRVDTRTGEVEWFDFSHSRMDGMGGLTLLLRRMGYRLDSLPRSRESRAPAPLARPGIIWRGLRALRSRTIRWKEFNRDAPKPENHDFPYAIFTREQTAAIENAAKNRGVSVNALLLETANRVLLPRLLEKGTSGCWLFPVNMRGVVYAPSELANQSAAIPVEADARTSALDIHHQIRTGLRNRLHWAAWWSLQIGRLVGLGGMRRISERSARNSFWLGTFSNMGAWPPPEAAPRELDPSEAWICTPPGTPNYPLSVACITWNGRLSLTLKIHPAICSDSGAAHECLEKIRKLLCF